MATRQEKLNELAQPGVQYSTPDEDTQLKRRTTTSSAGLVQWAEEILVRQSGQKNRTIVLNTSDPGGGSESAWYDERDQQYVDRLGTTKIEVEMLQWESDDAFPSKENGAPLGSVVWEIYNKNVLDNETMLFMLREIKPSAAQTPYDHTTWGTHSEQQWRVQFRRGPAPEAADLLEFTKIEEPGP